MEDFLHVKQNSLSFGEEWAKYPPKDAKGQTRDEYMKMVCHYLLFPYRMSRLISYRFQEISGTMGIMHLMTFENSMSEGITRGPT
jgi:hypothetical protein